HWLGLKRREMVEITATRGRNVPSRSPRRETARPAMSVSIPPRNGSPVARAAAEPGKQLLESPAATNALMAGFSQELLALQSMVKDLTVETRQRNTPQVPEEVFPYYS